MGTPTSLSILTSTRRILSHSNIAIMGNDGGSIPKRRELVKDAARAATLSELKATALESLAHAWSHCALSGDPIDLDSVVSDWRGRLYSYEAVLTGLTSDSDDGDSTQTTPSSLGIKSLRDVAKLKFNRTGDKWTCPISMKELGPSTKTVYIVPCGHVFAEVAMKEIKEKACPECSEEFKEENTITILPTTDEETERLQKRMEDLRAAGLTHTLKKDKSEKKKKRKAGESNGIANHEGKNGEPNGVKKDDGPRASNGINNSSAASVTAKVMAEQEERNKRRKLAADSAPKSVSVGRSTPQSLQMGKT